MTAADDEATLVAIINRLAVPYHDEATGNGDDANPEPSVRWAIDDQPGWFEAYQRSVRRIQRRQKAAEPIDPAVAERLIARILGEDPS
jgi:hypothetical protein